MTATADRYVIPSPCAKCPFLARFKGDEDYLREGRRAGIARGLLDGHDFPCHETIDHADADHEYGDGCADDCEEHVSFARSVTCAGAALVMLRAGHEGPLKFANRLGLVDVEAFEARNSRVKLWTLDECLADGASAAILDDDGEILEDTCSVVNPGCLAPAGWMIGGAAVRGDVTVDTTCPSCGEFVCVNCSDDDGLCLNGMCSEGEEPE